MISPTFTVIIATCGRPARLQVTLDAVATAIQEHGADDRIIVIDNHPDYNAEETVHVFDKESTCAVQYMRSRPRDKSAALNMGVDAAGTEWLAFTDDDTVPDGMWLKQAAAFIADTSFDVFAGRVVPGEPPANLPEWMKPHSSGRVPRGGVYVRYELEHGSGPLLESDTAPYGANAFIRKSVFTRYGKYDEALWALCGKRAVGVEDSELGIRLKSRKVPMGYCREAFVVHPVHVELCGFWTHIRRAYDQGWREPIVCFNEKRPLFEPYRVRLVLVHTVRSLCDLLRGDSFLAVDHLVDVARAIGGMMGRCSGAYRRRLISVRMAHDSLTEKRC